MSPAARRIFLRQMAESGASPGGGDERPRPALHLAAGRGHAHLNSHNHSDT